MGRDCGGAMSRKHPEAEILSLRYRITLPGGSRDSFAALRNHPETEILSLRCGITLPGKLSNGDIRGFFVYAVRVLNK